MSRRECEYSNKPEDELTYNLESLYTYDGDKLLSYGNELIEYDAIGNSTTYRGKTVTWSCGRQMTNYNGIAIVYDGYGRRTSKGNITYTYDSSNRIIKQSNGLEFIYDNSGVAGFTYNSATYLYQKDVLGNICKIIDSSGNVVVQYKYDAWGNHTIETAEPSYLALAELNPFRYRSYYYDSEIKLYYLKSRYYDPETGRFITIDDTSYLDPDTINGLNLYAYCGNNPVMNVDPEGTSWWKKFFKWLAVAVVAVVAVAAIVVGTIFTGGILGGFVSSVLIGFGTGTLSGMSTGIISQGINNGWNNIDPLRVLIDSAIGGFVGAIGGAISWGAAIIGSNIGSSFGLVLSSKSILGKPIGNIISSTLLQKIGAFIGGFSFSITAGIITNNFFNFIFKSNDNILNNIQENVFGELFGRILNNFGLFWKSI